MNLRCFMGVGAGGVRPSALRERRGSGTFWVENAFFPLFFASAFPLSFSFTPHFFSSFPHFFFFFPPIFSFPPFFLVFPPFFLLFSLHFSSFYIFSSFPNFFFPSPNFSHFPPNFFFFPPFFSSNFSPNFFLFLYSPSILSFFPSPFSPQFFSSPISPFSQFFPFFFFLSQFTLFPLIIFPQFFLFFPNFFFFPQFFPFFPNFSQFLPFSPFSPISSFSPQFPPPQFYPFSLPQSFLFFIPRDDPFQTNRSSCSSLFPIPSEFPVLPTGPRSSFVSQRTEPPPPPEHYSGISAPNPISIRSPRSLFLRVAARGHCVGFFVSCLLSGGPYASFFSLQNTGVELGPGGFCASLPPPQSHSPGGVFRDAGAKVSP